MNLNGNPTHTKFVRRAAIRRILSGRYNYAEGVTSYEQLQKELEQHGHHTSIMTIRQDMEALGATKIKVEGEARSFWFIPPWNPEMAHLSDIVDQDTVEQEVAARIAAYGKDAFTWGCEVILLGEQNCGRMLADWIAMLQWPGMLHVREHAHSVSVLCESEEIAVYVRDRLIGVAS